MDNIFQDEQVKSFLRTLVQSGAVALASKGVIDQSAVPVIVGFVLWLIPTAWGLYVRRKAGLVASAAALPEVKQIIASAAIVDKVERPDVTTR